MTLESIRAALAWCTVINLGLLTGWWLLFALAHDWIYQIHGKWFNLFQAKQRGFADTCNKSRTTAYLDRFLWGFRPAGPVFPDIPA